MILSRLDSFGTKDALAIQPWRRRLFDYLCWNQPTFCASHLVQQFIQSYFWLTGGLTPILGA